MQGEIAGVYHALLQRDAISYSDKNRIGINIGSEVGIYDILFIRGGYKNSGLNRFSVGGGLSLGKRVQVDFAWLPYNKIEQNLWNYSISLKF